MLRRLRKHLTYANVVASLALFLALGGVAWAASLPRNSVGASQIKEAAVSKSEIKDKAVRTQELKDRGIAAVDIGLDAAGGNEVNEGSLGQVPGALNADNLGGAGPGTYNIGRAYALIDEDGPTVVPERSRNVVGATNPQGGIYCVTLAAGIDVATVAPVLTLEESESATIDPPPGTSDDQGFLEWDVSPNVCPAGTLEIESFVQSFSGGALNGNAVSNQTFTIFIP